MTRPEFLGRDSRARQGGVARLLRDLGDARAPGTIFPAVLERLGLGDAYGRLDTPIGPVFVAYNAHGVSAVRPGGSAKEFEAAFRTRFGRPIRRAGGLPAALAGRLGRAFRGTGRPSVHFDLRSVSEFERAVLRKALSIPRGEVRPYGWIAREIGRPAAARAVGTALARNPIPLLIPCHRVVRNDGRVGGYLFGPEFKRRVLADEGVDVEALEARAHAGTQYYGSDTTRIYCFPTCRNARRISPAHRVSFRSAAEARGAGYRPCAVCRPSLAS
ncbi:MAG: methylated-DNA--[protein]-cysteine S-methyltransferase [Bacillati bacterium ANGP1]|uniref:methylated-DNA--[protein]-cysteine S-methyltransferase n=1 Tax=Candidatus Segetimicrobium genomatis TaxID=2569760 RepID=A0A537JFR9_9BACT|nr:MAG: methylated-DNA--[protein]-cysteine S-methyltransferase [Terrabacteria group bacterium ANGP1]